MAAQRRTTSELADALGISHNSARRRMTGEGTFTLNQLQAAADWLGVRISDIITPTPGLDYGHPQ
jgi:transcriptional regulator with XRE-family HTH domain